MRGKIATCVALSGLGAALTLTGCGSGNGGGAGVPLERTYEAEARGNLAGQWSTESASGVFNLWSGSDRLAVRSTAGYVRVVVTGYVSASCTVRDDAGHVVAEQNIYSAPGVQAHAVCEIGK